MSTAANGGGAAPFPFKCPICCADIVTAYRYCPGCGWMGHLTHDETIDTLNSLLIYANPKEHCIELEYRKILHNGLRAAGIQLYLYRWSGSLILATIGDMFVVNPLFFESLKLTQEEADKLLIRKLSLANYGEGVRSIIPRRDFCDNLTNLSYGLEAHKLEEGLTQDGQKYVRGDGAADYITNMLNCIYDVVDYNPYSCLENLWDYTLLQSKQLRKLKT